MGFRHWTAILATMTLLVATGTATVWAQEIGGYLQSGVEQTGVITPGAFQMWMVSDALDGDTVHLRVESTHPVTVSLMAPTATEPTTEVASADGVLEAALVVHAGAWMSVTSEGPAEYTMLTRVARGEQTLARIERQRSVNDSAIAAIRRQVRGEPDVTAQDSLMETLLPDADSLFGELRDVNPGLAFQEMMIRAMPGFQSATTQGMGDALGDIVRAQMDSAGVDLGLSAAEQDQVEGYFREAYQPAALMERGARALEDGDPRVALASFDSAASSAALLRRAAFAIGQDSNETEQAATGNLARIGEYWTRAWAAMRSDFGAEGSALGSLAANDRLRARALTDQMGVAASDTLPGTDYVEAGRSLVSNSAEGGSVLYYLYTPDTLHVWAAGAGQPTSHVSVDVPRDSLLQLLVDWRFSIGADPERRSVEYLMAGSTSAFARGQARVDEIDWESFRRQTYTQADLERADSTYAGMAERLAGAPPAAQEWFDALRTTALDSIAVRVEDEPLARDSILMSIMAESATPDTVRVSAGGRGEEDDRGDTATRDSSSSVRGTGIRGRRGVLQAELGRSLADILVPEEIRSILDTRGPLLIVPDGPIGLISFAALPLSSDGRDDFLGLTHDLRYAPSLSAAEAATGRPGRSDRRASLRAGLWVGDPLMPPGPVPGAAPDAPDLTQLPGAQAEVLVLADRYGSVALTGAAATETMVRERIREAPVIHLATHGMALSGTQQATDSSWVALAPSSEDDGFLTMGEVLREIGVDAELVVLSACQTGLGNLQQGEGTLGFQRAFLASGARSVLVSLWDVDDVATGFLMDRFYEHWVAGSTKAEALRRAQEDLRAESSDFHDPRFWAGFQLVGAN